MKHGNNDIRFGFHAASFSEPMEGIVEKTVTTRTNHIGKKKVFGRWYVLEWS